MRFVQAIILSVFVVSNSAAVSEDYPSRSIRMVVPFAAGGPADVVGRIVATDLSNRLGQQVYIENKTGAGIVVGTDFAAKAESDGYTMLLSTIAHSIAPSMFKSLPYDPVKDFTPIGLIGSVPLVMVVRSTLEVSDVKGFVNYAKVNPGKLNYGSAGNGAIDHLSSAMFASRTGLDVVHIKYRGTAPAIQDLVAGRLDFMISTSSVMLPYIQSGSLKALAVMSPRRLQTLPDVPTITEVGFNGFDMSAWYSLLAPARIPSFAVEKLNQALRGALANPGTRKRLEDIGAVIADDPSPQFLAKYMVEEQARWADVLKSTAYAPE